MAEWEKPETLTTEEVVAFLRNEHAMHGIGFGYNNGVGVVAGVYEEAARRLLRAERALKPILDYKSEHTWNLDDFMAACHCMDLISESQRIYNGEQQ